MGSTKIIINNYEGMSPEAGKSQTELSLPTPLEGEGVGITEISIGEMLPAPTTGIQSGVNFESEKTLPFPTITLESGMTGSSEFESLPSPDIGLGRQGGFEGDFGEVPTPASTEELKSEGGKMKNETIPKPQKNK
jgi:hypothetical protein